MTFPTHSFSAIAAGLLSLCAVSAVSAGGAPAPDRAAAATATSVKAPAPLQGTATVTIDLLAEGTELNHKVFGQLIPGADNYGIFSIPYPDLAVLHEGDGIWNPQTRRPFGDPWRILKSYRPGSLRYPDGLGVHNHDWKKTIGPLEERGDWKFGLDEFMSIAKALVAEPVFVVSEYIGTPQDAADLVEYLNMPATEQYPWAMRRAANGHPEPYNVKYFEMGNESWVDWRKIGKTEVRPADEVGRYASALAAAMKAVDPTILCGIPYGQQHWNRGVFANISGDIDFFVVHSYPVKYGGGDIDGPKEKQLLEAMMAGGQAASFELLQAQEEVREITGRQMPLMVTEYNTGPTQQISDLERPYRFTLASALGTADFIGLMLEPQSNVLAASYWSWLNGFFGAIKTYAKHPWYDRTKLDTPELRPTHYILELWGTYRGDVLLEAQVQTARVPFAGFTTLMPQLGDAVDEAHVLSAKSIFDGVKPAPKPEDGIVISAPASVDGQWTLHYDNFNRRAAYPFLFIRGMKDIAPELRPPSPAVGYKFTFDALWEPAEGSASPNLGFQIADSRGWKASGSAAVVRGVESATGDWQTFTAMYTPVEDTPAIMVLNRIETGSEAVQGKLHIRNMRAEPWKMRTLPARPALRVFPSLSADGKTLYLMVLNLTLDTDIATDIVWDETAFAGAAARYSEVNGESALAGIGGVSFVAQGEALDLISAGSLRHVFPAHSATGIAIELKPQAAVAP